jgi:hypothetical protein
MKASNRVKSKPEEVITDRLTESNPARKKYQRPHLKVYGDIRSITHGGKASKISDSGSNLMSPP